MILSRWKEVFEGSVGTDDPKQLKRIIDKD
jgi:hypothetical protein